MANWKIKIIFSFYNATFHLYCFEKYVYVFEGSWFYDGEKTIFFNSYIGI